MSQPDTQSESSQVPPTEELVAYLDGELEPAVARGIEELIARNADVRQHVDALQHTWQMLESLEPVHASEQFASRTLESIEATVIGEDVSEAATPRSAWLPQRSDFRNLGIWLLCGLIAAYFGTYAAALFKPPLSERDERLLNTYPVLKRFQEYRSIPDAEFLRNLKDIEFPASEQLRGGGR